MLDVTVILKCFIRYDTNVHTTLPDFTLSTPNNVLEVHEHPEEVDLVIKNNQVILGPYHDVNSLEHGIFEVQYELTGAVPHVRRLRREIEVSQWGNNLAVEEHYNFVNRGAEYVSSFILAYMKMLCVDTY
jgi:oligosaccharyltransferase complex subunit alpha (ribophorin I)